MVTKSMKSVKPTKIFQWVMASRSVDEMSGQRAQYSIYLWSDGSLSCDCPGWIIWRKRNNGHCKHTRQVNEEAKTLYSKFKKGETLPTFKETIADSVMVVEKTIEAIRQKESHSDSPKYGRVLVMD